MAGADTAGSGKTGGGESLASWLGINRATLAVLVVTAGLGLSEEIWRNFLAIHLKDSLTGINHTAQVLGAVKYMGIFAVLVNLLEGFGYIIGGAVAHRMGARVAFLVSALPMTAGFCLLLATRNPLLIIAGALLVTNWESLSVPATFEVVGNETPSNRLTIAFAMQSIQKRLPKVFGPLIGGFVMAVGYWVNLSLAFGLVVIVSVIQFTLLGRMRPKDEGRYVPLKLILKDMPPHLKSLLSAEIILRWGDWFVRDFAVLYLVGVLAVSAGEAGMLVALSGLTALITYIPVGKMVDNASSPRLFIGLTFFLFALFPLNLVLLPQLSPLVGVPVMGALIVVFILNGLREVGEPARKAMISSGFPRETRARAIGLYWGLRSFAFCPAPLISYLLWSRLGPESTFLIGGVLGMVATLWFWLRVRFAPTGC
ncbi:MAG: MFS transporter [Deltaproteobacteria bacterium]|nr:MFS transporter [Deltaproteobacteria bacterium]